MATEFFSIFIMWRASNQSILSLRLASTTADLIPYPFGSGIEEQIPVLPGRSQVPVPALAAVNYMLTVTAAKIKLQLYCSNLFLYFLWQLSTVQTDQHEIIFASHTDGIPWTFTETAQQFSSFCHWCIQRWSFGWRPVSKPPNLRHFVQKISLHPINIIAYIKLPLPPNESVLNSSYENLAIIVQTKMNVISDNNLSCINKVS